MLYLTLLHNVSPILMLLTVQTNKISPEFLLPYMLLFFALRKIYHNINITKNTRVTCQHSALNPEICACPELRVSKAEETTTLDPRPSLSGQVRRTISHAQKGIVLGLRMRKLRVATWNCTQHCRDFLPRCYYTLQKCCHISKLPLQQWNIVFLIHYISLYPIIQDSSLYYFAGRVTILSKEFSLQWCVFFFWLTSVHIHFRL